MFIYMSKKIAIPKHAGVSCLAWNQQSGYIAVGGDEGMLKVLKLESGGGGNLSMNLSLEGHSGQLQVATWNEVHQKLTTSDQHGVIIVWMLYKGSWYEEMINNRNKSTVSGMAWSSDGQKICIAYEDGAVIVGSVDGSRVWGKDIKGPGLSAVQWSPDNSLLLFALSTGELQLYDNQGNFAMSVTVQCASLPMRMVGMDWYSGHVSSETPALAICYQNGRVQLMKRHNDDNVVIIDSGLTAVSCHWNHNGSVVAIAGKTAEDSNAVQFFTPFGEHLRTLRVPGGNLKACVWEGRSLRVAIAVDSYIYFANVKPDYKKAYFGNTLAYNSNPHTVTFWDTVTNQSWLNNIPNVVDMSGVNDYCVVATPHSLVVCNQQGIQCDAKITPMEICYVCMNSKNSVIAASKDCFMLWRFATPSKAASKEQIFYSDGTPCLGEFQTSQDPICCLACSDSLLLIGRESGDILSYSLPDLSSEKTYKMNNRPLKLAINCNSTEFSVIDSGGCLFLISVGTSSTESGSVEVRRDVWGAVWAADNPRLLAAAERARLYTFRGREPQEPLPMHGYLCHFQDLEIVCANLSELGERGSTEHLNKMEVKSLRDTRQLLDKVGLREAEAFIKDNPHPKLWRLLAEAALRKLDLLTAETAYVHCGDYPGIQLVKRLAALRGTALRSAEVLACFKQFDEAEKIYLQEDRRDLAINLRQRLGHWFRVVELLKMSTNTTDEQLKEAYRNIGDYYWDRQNWSSAREYYTLAHHQDGVIKCHVALEDHEALANLTISSPKKSTAPPKEAKTRVENDAMNGEQPTLAAALQLKETGQFSQAASVIMRLADSEDVDRISPVKMKKLYVLAGHLYQSSGDITSASNAFSKAGSWHWLSLAQGGSLPAALRLRSRRPAPPKAAPALTALALNAANARAFATCSEAFVQLESLPEKEAYEELAVEIFNKHSPVDPKVNRAECTACHTMVSEWSTSCLNCGADFPGCVLTGLSIRDPHSAWTCRTCNFTVAQQEVVLRQTCPVCHTSVK